MKLKTFLFALLSILTLNVFSQFPVNVYVVGGNPNCPVTVMGYYASPDSSLTGNLTFTYSPNGLWISSVPTPTADVVVSVCAIDCMGASQCTGGPITPGTVTTFDIVLNTLSDMDMDGYSSPEDCDDNNPYIHPNAPEMCDGLDNNCDGVIETEPSISMYFVPDSVVSEPNSIYVICQTTNITSWTWDFQNGVVDSTPYPTTSYGSTGTYTFCLYGTSPEGCMTDSCLSFTIDSTGWFPGGIMSEYTLNIVPDYTTGVEVLTNNIKVWPNPIGEVINISAPSNNTNVKIMSVDGKVVFSQNFNQKQIQIDGNLLSNGSYVIVMTDDSGKVYTTRIIK
jgi:hypothetical protein